MNINKNLINLCGLLAMAACGGGQSSQFATVKGGSYSVPEMNGPVKCYRGIASIKMQGSNSEAETYWRRAHDVAGKKITEDAVTISGGNPSRVWSELSWFDGNKWSVKGSYKGGTFDGFAFDNSTTGAWTEWNVITTLDVGPKVVSKHAVVGDEIVSESAVLNNDVAGMVVKQRVSPISDELCQQAFSQWQPL